MPNKYANQINSSPTNQNSNIVTTDPNTGLQSSSTFTDLINLNKATTAEVLAGANDTKVITPAKLKDVITTNNAANNVILAGKEDLSNKATDLTVPNNTKYPTTKAVADAIAAIPAAVVVDNLTSPSATSSLSAKQGKILNDADILSVELVSNNIVFTKKDNTTFNLDATLLLKDVRIVSSVFNSANQTIDFTLSDGTVVALDATQLVSDIKVQSAVYNSTTKNLEFTLSNGTVFLIGVADLLPVTHNNTLVGDGATTPLGVAVSATVGNLITKEADGLSVLSTATQFATRLDLEGGVDTTKAVNTLELKNIIQTNEYKRGVATFNASSGSVDGDGNNIGTDTWTCSLDYPVVSLKDGETFQILFSSNSIVVKDIYELIYPQFIKINSIDYPLKVIAKFGTSFRDIGKNDIRQNAVHTITYNDVANVFQLEISSYDPEFKDTILTNSLRETLFIKQSDGTNYDVRRPIDELLQNVAVDQNSLREDSYFDYLAASTNLHRKATIADLKNVLNPSTNYSGIVNGAAGNYTATLDQLYSTSVVNYRSNFLYRLIFVLGTPDDLVKTLDLGFGAKNLKTQSYNSSTNEVLANQITDLKEYLVTYNQNTDEFLLIDPTPNIVSISEVVSTAPNYAAPYTVFKAAPFDGQMIEVLFDTNSSGGDTLEVGFGPNSILFTNTQSLNKPLQAGMIQKATRYILVWNSVELAWNIMNYSTASAPTNTSQLLNDSDFATNAATSASLALKENLANKATTLTGPNNNTYPTTQAVVTELALKNNSKAISRTTAVTGAVPTAAEFANPKNGDTATIKLSNGIIEAYNYTTGAWVLAYSTTPAILDGNNAIVDRSNNTAAQAPTAVEIPTPINGDTADVYLLNGTREVYAHNGTAWALLKTILPTALDGNDKHIVRTNATANATPTTGEIAVPVNGDTAKVFLTDGSVEYWNFTTVWTKDITKLSELGNVRYGTTAPAALATDKKNDTYVQTSDGTATGTLINTFVYNGTAWQAQSAPTGIAQIYHGKHSAGQATTANTPMTFDTDLLSSGTNITKLSNTRFRLQAGAYTIQANAGAATAATQSTTFQIRNVTTGTFIGNQVIKNSPTGPSTSPQDYTNAFASLNFATATDIEFWALDTRTGLFGQGAPDQTNAYSWIHIEQKGTLPTALPTINDFFRSGTGTTLPDGTTDVNENISRIGKIGVNVSDPSQALSHLDNFGSLGLSITETSAAAYTVLDTDHTIILNAPTIQTVTIQSSASATRRELKIINNGAIDKVLSQSYTRIDGVTTTVIPASSSITIQSTGPLWKQTDAAFSSSQKNISDLVETAADLAGDDTFAIIDASDSLTIPQSSYIGRLDKYIKSPKAIFDGLQAPTGIIPATKVVNGVTLAAGGYYDANGNYTPNITLPIPQFDGQTFVVNHQATLDLTVNITNTDLTSPLILNTVNKGAEFVAVNGRFMLTTDSVLPRIKKYRVIQNLVGGNNTITHNLALATPFSTTVEVREDLTGALIATRALAETTNTLIINVTAAVTNARITIIG